MTYISGRISKNKHWQEDFQNAENYLKKKNPHDIISNPLRIDKLVQATFKNPQYEDYILFDIKALIMCNRIYMLRGWWRSRGARLEFHIAKMLGLEVIFQKRGDK